MRLKSAKEGKDHETNDFLLGQVMSVNDVYVILIRGAWTSVCSVTAIPQFCNYPGTPRATGSEDHKIIFSQKYFWFWPCFKEVHTCKPTTCYFTSLFSHHLNDITLLVIFPPKFQRYNFASGALVSLYFFSSLLWDLIDATVINCSHCPF